MVEQNDIFSNIFNIDNMSSNQEGTKEVKCIKFPHQLDKIVILAITHIWACYTSHYIIINMELSTCSSFSVTAASTFLGSISFACNRKSLWTRRLAISVQTHPNGDSVVWGQSLLAAEKGNDVSEASPLTGGQLPRLNVSEARPLFSGNLL